MHAQQTAFADADQECNDNTVQPPVRESAMGEGGYSQDFRIDPPGLRGLNRLAVRLNVLKLNGTISGWHLGHWKNRARTLHSILFPTALELHAARTGEA